MTAGSIHVRHLECDTLTVAGRVTTDEILHLDGVTSSLVGGGGGGGGGAVNVVNTYPTDNTDTTNAVSRGALFDGVDVVRANLQSQITSLPGDIVATIGPLQSQAQAVSGGQLYNWQGTVNQAIAAKHDTINHIDANGSSSTFAGGVKSSTLASDGDLYTGTSIYNAVDTRHPKLFYSVNSSNWPASWAGSVKSGGTSIAHDEDLYTGAVINSALGGKHATINHIDANGNSTTFTGTVKDVLATDGNLCTGAAITNSFAYLFNGKHNLIPLDGSTTSPIGPFAGGVKSTPLASNGDLYTGAAISTALGGKQDTLSFDTSPTSSSTNPVESGGVYTELGNKQNTLFLGSAQAPTSTAYQGTVNSTVENRADELCTGAAITTSLGEKQAKIYVDSSTTAFSGRVKTSFTGDSNLYTGAAIQAAINSSSGGTVVPWSGFSVGQVAVVSSTTDTYVLPSTSEARLFLGTNPSSGAFDTIYGMVGANNHLLINANTASLQDTTTRKMTVGQFRPDVNQSTTTDGVTLQESDTRFLRFTTHTGGLQTHLQHTPNGGSTGAIQKHIKFSEVAAGEYTELVMGQKSVVFMDPGTAGIYDNFARFTFEQNSYMRFGRGVAGVGHGSTGPGSYQSGDQYEVRVDQLLGGSSSSQDDVVIEVARTGTLGSFSTIGNAGGANDVFAYQQATPTTMLQNHGAVILAAGNNSLTTMASAQSGVNPMQANNPGFQHCKNGIFVPGAYTGPYEAQIMMKANQGVIIANRTSTPPTQQTTTPTVPASAQGGNLTVQGVTLLQDDLHVDGDVECHQKLTVRGDLDVHTNATVRGGKISVVNDPNTSSGYLGGTTMELTSTGNMCQLSTPTSGGQIRLRCQQRSVFHATTAASNNITHVWGRGSLRLLAGLNASNPNSNAPGLGEVEGGIVIQSPQYSGGSAGSNYTSGTITLYASASTYYGSWGQGSDDRIKSHTTSMNDAMALIRQVQVKDYMYHPSHIVAADDENTDLSNVAHSPQYGVIAQDVEVIPGLERLVHTTTDGPGLKSVDYISLSVLTLRALQQSDARVTALEARLAALEAAGAST